MCQKVSNKADVNLTAINISDDLTGTIAVNETD